MSRLDAMAQHMWDARRARTKYVNLPDALKPASIAEAYRAQDVYYRLAEPVYGPVGGVKVATTTKVMQELMGITHPCGGAIFANTIHASPARIKKSCTQVCTLSVTRATTSCSESSVETIFCRSTTFWTA